jgi:hypothetical protein
VFSKALGFRDLQRTFFRADRLRAGAHAAQRAAAEEAGGLMAARSPAPMRRLLNIYRLGVKELISLWNDKMLLI